MFIGHFALAYAAKRKAPAVPLGVLFLAAQWPDVVWPLLVLSGIEQVRIEPGITAVTPLDFVSYPYSHSLAFDLLWAMLLGAVWWSARRDRIGALILGLLVVSHWLLDFASHRPDVPLWPGGPLLGLGLWYSLPATFAVEFALFAAGIWVYARAPAGRLKARRVGFWALAAVLAVLYLAATLGPPPPSVTALAWSALLGLLLMFWANWVDRRVPDS